MTHDCDAYARAILEEQPLPGLAAHLAACAECGELARGHRAARALAGARPAAHRVPTGRVLRRAAVAAVLIVAAGVAVGTRGSHGEPAPAGEPERAVAPPLQPEGRLVAAAPQGDDEAWQALIALERAVALELHRDPLVADSTYAPFGALPQWVALASARPMQELGVTVSPLVSPQED